VINIADINSPYDDYNVALYQLSSSLPIIFSSNRKSSGGQFDIEQASISFSFDQTNGSFKVSSAMTNDQFLLKLINAAKTAGNDFGPNHLYSPTDGFEYLLLSSVSSSGNLDLYYLKHRSVSSSNLLPDVLGPYPIKLLNTLSDDAYICLDSNLDSAYFTSSRDGNFDIFLHTRPVAKELDIWFNLNYELSTKVDSINSSDDDKCPMVYKKVLVFSSNRPGGLGGFDLYYSIFRKGKWSSPVNFGPGINTSADEYRPVIGYNSDYTNLFMMFSSDKPGGKGKFDLYLTGVDFPK
jgi:hypothetical protein